MNNPTDMLIATGGAVHAAGTVERGARFAAQMQACAAALQGGARSQHGQSAFMTRPTRAGHRSCESGWTR